MVRAATWAAIPRTSPATSATPPGGTPPPGPAQRAAPALAGRLDEPAPEAVELELDPFVVDRDRLPPAGRAEALGRRRPSDDIREQNRAPDPPRPRGSSRPPPGSPSAPGGRRRHGGTGRAGSRRAAGRARPSASPARRPC